MPLFYDKAQINGIDQAIPMYGNQEFPYFSCSKNTLFPLSKNIITPYKINS